MFVVEVMTKMFQVYVTPTYSTRKQACDSPMHHGCCTGKGIQGDKSHFRGKGSELLCCNMWEEKKEIQAGECNIHEDPC